MNEGATYCGPTVGIPINDDDKLPGLPTEGIDAVGTKYDVAPGLIGFVGIDNGVGIAPAFILGTDAKIGFNNAAAYGLCTVVVVGNDENRLTLTLTLVLPLVAVFGDIAFIIWFC